LFLIERQILPTPKSAFVDEIGSMKILSYSITGEIARSSGQTGVVTGEWQGRWFADGKKERIDCVLRRYRRNEMANGMPWPSR
jgi:hypothetical protein